jgi:hypothetical protein
VEIRAVVAGYRSINCQSAPAKDRTDASVEAHLQTGRCYIALHREQIAFVAFGGWDAAGAKSWLSDDMDESAQYANGAPRRASGQDRIELRSAARICRRAGPLAVAPASRAEEGGSWVEAIPECE